MGRSTTQAWFSAFSTLVERFGSITFLLLSSIMVGVNWNAFLHRRIRRAKNSFVLKNETRTKTSAYGDVLSPYDPCVCFKFDFHCK